MTFWTLVLPSLGLLVLGGLAGREAHRNPAWRPLAAVLFVLGGLGTVAALVGLVLLVLYTQTTQ
ncbi:hypothetical protein [Deinococcus budaensis]|uniref:Uncharacterized protein n=1 Tax=Deinococcus budaensis TaxID=1665626 RepID=A0A7W8LRQ7_9DEIO|nr:hypothetical protein [Deinococcus budaensis]MBB5236074.1 hypothetical protein [Deinococcus budaensis]